MRKTPGINSGDPRTDADFVQNDAEDTASESDIARTSIEQGRTGSCKQDGSHVAPWKYAVAACTD